MIPHQFNAINSKLTRARIIRQRAKQSQDRRKFKRAARIERDAMRIWARAIGDAYKSLAASLDSFGSAAARAAEAFKLATAVRGNIRYVEHGRPDTTGPKT